MNVKGYIKGYKQWLLLERNLSPQTITSYLSDLQLFSEYIEDHRTDKSGNITSKQIQDYLSYFSDNELSAATQARMLSTLRSFFQYLQLEEIIRENPAKLIDMPRQTRKLPVVLSVEEVYQILDSIDLSKPGGERNKAILEVLYGCGLRVSELVNLHLSDLFLKNEYIRIIGKGNKERLVPIARASSAQLQRYINQVRVHEKIDPQSQDIVFLNRSGKKLSRVSVYNIIKACTEQSGVRKNVSPHTFRHSFASHLVEGGANLRAVQQMLGHVSITTTEIYTHMSTRYLRDAIMHYHPLESKGHQ